MIHALQTLARATTLEAARLYDLAPEPTQRVLISGGPLKNVPFMREVSFVTGCADHNLLPDSILGLPMLGWALQAPTMTERQHLPNTTIDDLKTNAPTHNTTLIHRTRPSTDPTLDRTAWEKSMDEVTWAY